MASSGSHISTQEQEANSKRAVKDNAEMSARPSAQLVNAETAVICGDALRSLRVRGISREQRGSTASSQHALVSPYIAVAVCCLSSGVNTSVLLLQPREVMLGLRRPCIMANSVNCAFHALQNPSFAGVKQLEIRHLHHQVLLCPASISILKSLPDLCALSLCACNLSTLTQLKPFAQLGQLTRLDVRGNKVASVVLLRPWVACTMPHIVYVNSDAITAADTKLGIEVVRPMLDYARSLPEPLSSGSQWLAQAITAASSDMCNGDSAARAQRTKCAYEIWAAAQATAARLDEMERVWDEVVEELVLAAVRPPS
jgi:hypothetical protein